MLDELASLPAKTADKILESLHDPVSLLLFGTILLLLVLWWLDHREGKAERTRLQAENATLQKRIDELWQERVSDLRKGGDTFDDVTRNLALVARRGRNLAPDQSVILERVEEMLNALQRQNPPVGRLPGEHTYGLFEESTAFDYGPAPEPEPAPEEAVRRFDKALRRTRLMNERLRRIFDTEKLLETVDDVVGIVGRPNREDG